MTKSKTIAALAAFLFILNIALTGCSLSSKSTAGTVASTANNDIITIGAYSILQPSLDRIIPLFQQQWQKQTGHTIKFYESYQGSSTQATAIIQGFDADIALLASEDDVQKIVGAGLIAKDWKSEPYKGIITRSIVAIGVRTGNPKRIHGWSDLAKPGVQVLLPNPSTSGGAKWDINAIYGAGLKSSEEAGTKDPLQAEQLLGSIYKNVKALDKSGADSLTTFERGVGDAVITYENELIVDKQMGEKITEVIPNHTIMIENPAVLVDHNIDKHGNRKAAEAFLNFLWSTDAQEIFADNGFQPVNDALAAKYRSNHQTNVGLFDISYLGGWDQVNRDLYAPGAIWESILAAG